MGVSLNEEQGPRAHSIHTDQQMMCALRACCCVEHWLVLAARGFAVGLSRAGSDRASFCSWWLASTKGRQKGGDTARGQVTSWTKELEAVSAGRLMPCWLYRHTQDKNPGSATVFSSPFSPCVRSRMGHGLHRCPLCPPWTGLLQLLKKFFEISNLTLQILHCKFYNLDCDDIFYILQLTYKTINYLLGYFFLKNPVGCLCIIKEEN